MGLPRARLILRLYIITFIYLTVAYCRLRDRYRQAKRALEEDKGQNPPEDHLGPGEPNLKDLKIPNWDFCTEMFLRPEDHNLVLPWWYHYCQNVKRKHLQNKFIDYNEMQKYVKEEVELFRKRLKGNATEFTALEKDLLQSIRK